MMRKPPKCSSKFPTCPNPASWVVTDPESGKSYPMCDGHVDLYRTGPKPWRALKIGTGNTVEVDGVTVECIDQRVVEVEDDGTRVVRVTVLWGDDEVSESDVRFSADVWEAHGGK